ncbi:MAG: hypothetical protein NVSMB42_23740 [Herpetosiphon sp.]
MSPSDQASSTKSLVLIHHAANRGIHFPPSSFPGLKHCLDANARVIEVDIIPLLNGDFVLFHDENLEHGTDGQGPVVKLTAAEASRLHHVWNGAVTTTEVTLLSQLIETIRAYPALHELQLDLKPYLPLTDAILHNLLHLIEPVKRQIRITSEADWALRRLRALDSSVQLGFDPLNYLQLNRAAGWPVNVPPFRVGAFGYRDDHPLAARKWGSAADYLELRADVLAVQAPVDSMWFISASLLGAMLDDGFDWIRHIHTRGQQVAAWTLDPQPSRVTLARRLAASGVDRITTNDAPAMARLLDMPTTF